MLSKIKEFLFKNTGIKQTVFKNTFWLTLAESIARLSGLILLIYITRILGVNEYGKFTFALSFALIMSIFSDLGIAEISTREFSRDKENEKRLNSIFTLEVLLFISVIVITFISSFFITSDFYIRKIIWILIVYVLIGNIFGIFFSFLRARQKMEYEAIVKICQASLNIVLIFLILLYSPIATSISYGYLFSSFIVLLSFLLFFSLRFKPVALQFDKNIFNILKISWPLSLGFMPSWIYISLNSIILGYLGLITENGWYSAASRIAIIALIVANLVTRSFYPILSNLFFISKEKTQKAWNYLLESMIFLILPVMIGGLTLAPKIIYSFYGSGFEPSISALKILMLVVAISFINYPYTIIMIVADHQRQNFVFIVIGAIVNIVLDFIFIKMYGFYGILMSTIIASALVLFMTIFYLIRMKLISFFNKRLLGTFLVSMLAGFIMYLTISHRLVYNLNVIFTCLVGALVYFVLFFLLYRFVLLRKLV
ncbi:MAG: hypothetical protein A3D35_03320 [Candidatus Staskawiczbacteria bacterium RIFCSPHIGHO2_02_FULL_34_9]|uniref:Uncharacterized protein n=1 Tax=Candidatus Staskawiczbacteria bacterium RIFCSPHIGHO2_02_FULL_34_9 TaxID=1802206 RepID=A0A1G2I587_9BACT|nr:MAG: hypothetical protein A3D35_03320 [Candidatus Staskawiczbacteria bacterium RIFCSPHIGHO2_02_FULL_34_9]